MLIIGVTLSVCAFSQTVEQKVEKQIQDPKRKENAGKADVISTNKKSVFDSTTFSNSTEVVAYKKQVKTSAKKKGCSRKAKQGNAKSTSARKV
ncbi:MAG: hypothetical protein JWQ96_2984 [Segetibacter sp.]|nr:hypothetical protein [Segetibacter sp.]